MQQQLRLVDGADELVIWRLDDPTLNGIYTQELDVTSPAAREVVEDCPDDDGTDDDTQFHGAASVSLKLLFFDQPAALLDQIRPWLRFGRRPWLCLSDDEWSSERRIRLRADQWSAPMPHTGLGRWREVQLQWKAPDGAWIGSDPVEVTVDGVGGVPVGISFPLTFPITFEATAGIGQTVHTNTGDAAAHQKARLYGPCAGPRWTNDTTGESIVFTEALVIPAGDYVEIDTRDHTAYYLSDPNADRLSLLDYEATSWWKVPPGESLLRYHPTSQVNAGCAAVMTYQPTYSA